MLVIGTLVKTIPRGNKTVCIYGNAVQGNAQIWGNPFAGWAVSACRKCVVQKSVFQIMRKIQDNDTDTHNLYGHRCSSFPVDFDRESLPRAISPPCQTVIKASCLILIHT